MARMLYNPPNFLVLDEPTITWTWPPRRCWWEALKEFEGTMIFVSHDRTFLRGLSSRCWSWGSRAGGIAIRTCTWARMLEYVQKTGHEAPGDFYA